MLANDYPTNYPEAVKFNARCRDSVNAIFNGSITASTAEKQLKEWVPIGMYEHYQHGMLFAVSSPRTMEVEVDGVKRRISMAYYRALSSDPENGIRYGQVFDDQPLVTTSGILDSTGNLHIGFLEPVKDEGPRFRLLQVLLESELDQIIRERFGA